MKIKELQQSENFEEREDVCPGCQNKCQVHCYTFANGKTYYSGNNCERVYSNNTEGAYKGVNMFEEKYRLLFEKRPSSVQGGLTVGIPRGLGIYEDYPFWQTFFQCCGIRTVLSSVSTNRLYEKGVRTIVADNICFPAKLMHGHVMDLISKGVDRIFYPWVVYERAEDKQAKNSFNCPIVSGYSDVLKSTIRSEDKYGIPIDAPTISFKDEKLLQRSLCEYIENILRDGVANTEKMAEYAVKQALDAQKQYLERIEERNKQVFAEAEKAGRMVILLAALPLQNILNLQTRLFCFFIQTSVVHTPLKLNHAIT